MNKQFHSPYIISDLPCFCEKVEEPSLKGIHTFNQTMLKQHKDIYTKITLMILTWKTSRVERPISSLGSGLAPAIDFSAPFSVPLSDCRSGMTLSRPFKGKRRSFRAAAINVENRSFSVLFASDAEKKRAWSDWIEEDKIMLKQHVKERIYVIVYYELMSPTWYTQDSQSSKWAAFLI